MAHRNAAPFGVSTVRALKSTSSIRAAVRRGELVHVVGRSAFADFRHALCAWSAAEAARDEKHAEAAEPGAGLTRDVPLRRCDDCALLRGREFLRGLDSCPRWGMIREGVESRCGDFVPKDETR